MNFKLALLPLAVSSVLALSGCFHSDDHDEHAHCSDGSEAIADSSGRSLCFAIEYAGNFPQVEGAFVGKTVHTVTVTDIDGVAIDTATDAVITSVSQYPFMTMTSGHKHSTATANMTDATDSANGKYKMVSYYSMMSGDMGSWEYRVELMDNQGTADTTDDEHLVKVFVPNVMETEGVTATTQGSNAADEVAASDARPYRVWLESLAVNADGATHDITLYVSAKDGGTAMAMPAGHHMGMKVSSREMNHGAEHEMDTASYLAVHMGGELTNHMDAMAPIAINTVTVEVAAPVAVGNDMVCSTDTWTTALAELTAVSGMMGKYKAEGVAGLSTTAANDLCVKLTVNGNVMTTTDTNLPLLSFTAPAPAAQ